MIAAIFRGLGDSRSPLLFVLIACIINVFGDLLNTGYFLWLIRQRKKGGSPDQISAGDDGACAES